MFKFLGHTQLMEVCAIPKEIMLLHDNGFVLLRPAFGFNKSSIEGSYCDAMVE
jgi:hypothetical protein